MQCKHYLVLKQQLTANAYKKLDTLKKLVDYKFLYLNMFLYIKKILDNIIFQSKWLKRDFYIYFLYY